jgi:hypothetical protein
MISHNGIATVSSPAAPTAILLNLPLQLRFLRHVGISIHDLAGNAASKCKPVRFSPSRRRS